jgi:hypothetical protein
MNIKLEKYILKYFDNNNINKKDKKKYINKICQHGGYLTTSTEQILNYITEKIKKIEPTDNKTHKYCVVLFGPPASGKSKATDLAISMINNERKSNLKKSNFFELNIDSFVEETTEWQTLKSTDEELKNPDLVNKNKELYFDIRNKINRIFELFLNCCILLKLNFTLETTGINFDWHMEIIKNIKNDKFSSEYTMLSKYGYNFILMYPYTPNVDLLAKRAENRAIKSGRVITHDEFIKNNFINKANTSFNDIVLANSKYFYIICKYNAEINIEKQLLDNDDIYVYFINK